MDQLRIFEISISGKWVLAGEHAVIRGGEAICFPFENGNLNLKFQENPDGCGLRIKAGEFNEKVEEAVSNLLSAREFKSSVNPALVSGTINFSSTIPIGAGLGSSAALSVSLVKWAEWYSGTDLISSQVIELATEIENLFHGGRSSGMDVAAVEWGEPLLYQIDQEPKPLDYHQYPKLTLHDTGLRSSTAEQVTHVNNLNKKKPVLFRRLDQQMGDSVYLAQKGLELYADGQIQDALENIKESMDLGYRCFDEWGLVTPEISQMRLDLLNRGALGCKLTGAGKGGFLVALWPNGAV